jgi:hypothetical protein
MEVFWPIAAVAAHKKTQDLTKMAGITAQAAMPANYVGLPVAFADGGGS